MRKTRRKKVRKRKICQASAALQEGILYTDGEDQH